MQHYFNFSAGPAMLPAEVLREAEQELLNWQGTHSSVMEVSHRGAAFMQLAQESIADLRELLAVPDNYQILFCQGGARGQFSALPMNLLADARTPVDYLISGFWSQSAANEGQKYCQVNAIDLRYQDPDGQQALRAMEKWPLSASRYLHYCPNETIEGLAIHQQPQFADKIVWADLSSCLLSGPIDVSRYGVIYAGAQKNIGPAGLTIVIVRDDLLQQSQAYLPSILNYRLLAENDSMYNTPPTFAWYLAARVFKWLKRQGGLAQIAQLNQQKAQLLYQAIDNSDFYQNQVAAANRSLMNVPFTLTDAALTPLFIEQAQAQGLSSLKGHKVVGGIRASIYNAMPLAGVQALVDFMQEFAKRQG